MHKKDIQPTKQCLQPEHNRITPELFFLDMISIFLITIQVQQCVMSRTYDWQHAGGPGEVK